MNTAIKEIHLNHTALNSFHNHNNSPKIIYMFQPYKFSHLQKEYVSYIDNIFPEWLARYSSSLLFYEDGVFGTKVFKAAKQILYTIWSWFLITQGMMVLIMLRN
jgi:hypothetical protein